MILKNKFVGINLEDSVLNAIETWLIGNPKFCQLVYEQDQYRVSTDNSATYKQFEQMLENVNWPFVSL